MIQDKPDDETISVRQEAAGHGKLCILVVDDDKTLADTFGMMLELLGHDVKFAYDGKSALTAAQSLLPDVILLDISLSDMSGYDVCQQMRAEDGLKNCMIIAQTGWGQEEHRQRTKAAGFDHHLVKPIKLETLEELFSSLAV